MTIVYSKKRGESGIILETKGSVWKIPKRALFYYKKVKKGTSLYVHSLFATALIKQIFEKSMSLKAASGSQTQFCPKITPDSSLVG